METGYWAEEVVEPMEIFERAGIKVDVGTIGGRVPYPDQNSLSPGGAGSVENAVKFKKATDASPQLNNPIDLEKLDENSLKGYDAIFIAGGHGVLADLANSPKMGTVLASAIQNSNQIVSAVCHGGAAFKSLELVGGALPRGVQMTGFSEEEEQVVNLKGRVPFELESTLIGMGVAYSQSSQPFMPFVVKSSLLAHNEGDGSKFVTGQNPQSSKAVAEDLVAQIKSLHSQA